MTFRSPLLALKSFFAMLILFGLVFSVSVDATVCEPEMSELSSVEISGGEAGQELPSSPTEQHGICAHGHNHLSSQLAGSSDTAIGALCSSVHHSFEPVGLTPVQLGTSKPPPRI